MLILVCGLPATGKSTIANRLARRLNATLLRTDVVRKELFPAPGYTEEEKNLVYDITLLVARYLLRSGVRVVIDGTFYKRAGRVRAYRLAEETGKRLVIVECTCPDEVIQARMRGRGLREGLPTDADYQVYLKIKGEFEPIQRKHIVVDTSRPLRENLGDIYRYVGFR